MLYSRFEGDIMLIGEELIVVSSCLEKINPTGRAYRTVCYFKPQHLFLTVPHKTKGSALLTECTNAATERLRVGTFVYLRKPP